MTQSHPSERALTIPRHESDRKVKGSRRIEQVIALLFITLVVQLTLVGISISMQNVPRAQVVARLVIVPGGVAQSEQCFA